MKSQPVESLPSRLWKRRSSLIAAVTISAIVLYLAFRFLLRFPRLTSEIPLFVALGAGGIPLLFVLVKQLLARQFGSDLLAGLSIVTAILVGEFLVAAIVVLMLSGGQALEDYATRHASSVLDALAHRMPSMARRQRGEELVEIGLDEVRVGDSLTILPHEVCPVDGTVVTGSSTMDESYLTGEPFLMRKAPGSQVISGAINGESALVILADKLPVDSRYARIMKVVSATEHERPRMRRIADRLGAWYTPLAVLVAAAGWIAGGTPDRFLAVLVIATPCPLLLAIPVAIIGAISVSAKRGIIIKKPDVLERIDHCRTVIFDKTGTLTHGKPIVTAIRCAPGVERQQVLRLTASLEQYSKHPLASAVLRSAEEGKVALAAASFVSEKPGAGLLGQVDGHEVQVTGRRQISPEYASSLPSEEPGMECLVLVDGRFAAAVQFRDQPRLEGKSFIHHLMPKHQMTKIMLVSGDRESEVRYLAESFGIQEVFSGRSPEQKVAIVREEGRREKTLFVGDGINDAPAMLAATVGIAFGQNSDITAEAADAVVLEPSLAKVDELMHISRRMRRIALQSAVGGMALSVVGMAAAAAGYLPPIAGAIAQEVIDFVAVANAVRTAIPVKELTDFSDEI
jgi:heavy metal translocating P-type ATPase